MNEWFYFRQMSIVKKKEQKQKQNPHTYRLKKNKNTVLHISRQTQQENYQE